MEYLDLFGGRVYGSVPEALRALQGPRNKLDLYNERGENVGSTRKIWEPEALDAAELIVLTYSNRLIGVLRRVGDGSSSVWPGHREAQVTIEDGVQLVHESLVAQQERLEAAREELTFYTTWARAERDAESRGGYRGKNRDGEGNIVYRDPPSVEKIERTLRDRLPKQELKAADRCRNFALALGSRIERLDHQRDQLIKFERELISQAIY